MIQEVTLKRSYVSEIQSLLILERVSDGHDFATLNFHRLLQCDTGANLYPYTIKTLASKCI